MNKTSLIALIATPLFLISLVGVMVFDGGWEFDLALRSSGVFGVIGIVSVLFAIRSPLRENKLMNITK